MTTGHMKAINASVACLLVIALTGCGESDLVELQERELDDAIAAEEVEANALPAQLNLTGFELTFRDEFNDDSIDEQKWDTSLFGPDTVIFDQLQYYVDALDPEETLPSPFSFIDNDNLVISATSTLEDQRADANEQPYLSGILTTRDRFSMRYGYIEARIKLPEGRGTWPALWMLAAENNGRQPEVYIFEHDGGRPDRIFHNYNYVDDEGNLRSPGQQEVQSADISEGFHTFGLRWTESELLFYVDGQPSWRIIGENLPDEEMYLILNLAMGGIWTGAPDGTTPIPATLEIDYIRVYQQPEQ